MAFIVNIGEIETTTDGTTKRNILLSDKDEESVRKFNIVFLISNNSELIIMICKTTLQIPLTLWKQRAVDFTGKKRGIIVIHQGKTSSYEGFSISANAATELLVTLSTSPAHPSHTLFKLYINTEITYQKTCLLLLILKSGFPTTRISVLCQTRRIVKTTSHRRANITTIIKKNTISDSINQRC